MCPAEDKSRVMLEGPFATRRRIFVATGMAVFIAVVHVLWITIFLWHEDRCGTQNYMTVDTGHYLLLSETLFDARPAPPIFRERLLLPVLMAVVRAVGLRETAVLYLLALLHMPVVLSVIYLGWIFSGKRAGGYVGAFLYGIYPNAFRYGVQIVPDMLHAQLAVCALAASVAFVRLPSWGRLVAGSVAWMCVLLARPTFYPVSLALAVLVWPCLRNPATRWSAVFLMASPLTIPLTFSISHALIYGVPTPSFGYIENIHRAVVPRMRMFERSWEEPGRTWTELWSEERDRTAMQHPAWDQLALYYPAPVSEGFATAYRQMMSDAHEYISKRPKLFVFSGLLEIKRILFHATPVYTVGRQAGAQHVAWASRGHKMFLLLSCMGCLTAFARTTHRRLAAACLLLVGLSLAPSVLTWWITSDRMRLPMDLLVMPFVAGAFCNARALLAVLFTLIAGVLSTRWMHDSSAIASFYPFMVLMIAGVWLTRRELQENHHGE